MAPGVVVTDLMPVLSFVPRAVVLIAGFHLINPMYSTLPGLVFFGNVPKCVLALGWPVPTLPDSGLSLLLYNLHAQQYLHRQKPLPNG